jgi:hypothetical protein
MTYGEKHRMNVKVPAPARPTLMSRMKMVVVIVLRYAVCPAGDSADGADSPGTYAIG